MVENVFGFLLLTGMSAFCWAMVFRPSARRKLNVPACCFYRLDKEGCDNFDAMALVCYLVVAMVFSLMTITFIIVAVYRFFRPLN
jgi:hypothetical protein